MPIDQLAALAVFVSLMLGTVALLGKAWVWVWRTVQKIVRLVDDLTGEPPGPGEKDGKPGVLEQLAELVQASSQLAELQAAVEVLPAMRQHLAALDARLATVEGQLKPNGGGSIKDQVTRIEQATGAADRAA